MSRLLLSDTELERALDTLPKGHRVSLALGGRSTGWYRGEVRQHDPEQGRLVLTCFLDGGAVRAGAETLVCTQRFDGDFYAARMRVIAAGVGDEPAIALRQLSPWSWDLERRHDARVLVWLPAAQARYRRGAHWENLGAIVRDLSTSGLGLSLDRELELGTRISVALELPDGQGILRTRLEVRHAMQTPLAGRWLAGGEFHGLSPDHQERIIRYVFARQRVRQAATNT
jgi:PilZ domain